MFKCSIYYVGSKYNVYAMHRLPIHINYNVLMNNSNNLRVTIKILNINKTKNMAI